MEKLTVTLPKADVEAIRALITAGKVDSVSAFVRNAISVQLDDVAGWGAMLAQAPTDPSSGPALPDDQ